MDETFKGRTLATKLRPPAPGVRHMPRPRLFEALEGVDSFRLALVCAPAGCGKTTVLSEWHGALARRGDAAAWLSLDAFDSDPRRFVGHLIAAVRSRRPGFGRKASRLLAANPDVLVADLAAGLVEDFGGTAPPILIFLDDYHEIRDRATHGVVDFLLRYAPAGVRFVLGTRTDPPLPVGRLRLRGDVLDVRWEDLRFQVDEARDYLQGVCRLRVSDEQARLLCDRTEGWITGLQLAAMAFPEGEGADRFVTDLTGAQRHVADYLMDGVFRRQPPVVRSFLMRTSILDRICGPLCDAVSGRRDSLRLIEAVERGNLFLFGLDDHRRWYRYHHLFAEFLRSRLPIELHGETADLHERASVWFEKNGLPAEAARHAIAGGRHGRAARLVTAAGRELFRRGDFQELRRWIEALPDGTVRRFPALCALHAWALAYQGDLAAASARLACAEKALARSAKAPGDGPHAARVRAELQVLRAVLGIIRTDEPDVSGLHAGIVSLFPTEERVLRAFASITLGFASRVAGYLTVALRHFHEALRVSEDADSSLVNLNARLNIGVVNYLMGRMNDAEESFRASLAVSRERAWERSIGAAFLRYGLALVLQEKNRHEEARAELSDAIAFLAACDAFGFLGMALVERARVELALGRPDLAVADLARARQVARRHDVERVSFRADLLECRTALQGGDADKAEAFLESAGTALGEESFLGRPLLSERQEYFLIERLRVHLARGELAEAARLAGRGSESAASAGRGRNRIEFLVLEAEALHGLSETEEALDRLGQALLAAAPEGIHRPFATAGGAVVPLLARLAGRRATRAAAAGILAALEGPARPAPGRAFAGHPRDRFHPREVQILRLASEGLRNREIGRRLFLSEETVKWYLKRLFAGLCARTRTEAVASGRKLGLIS